MKKILNQLNKIIGRFGFVIVGKEWLRKNTFKIVDLRPSKSNITPMDILSFYATQDLMYVVDIPTEKVAKSKLLEAQIQTLKLRQTEDQDTENSHNTIQYNTIQYNTQRKF